MSKPLPKIEPCPRCKKRGVFEHDANKRLSFRCDCVYGPWKKTERAAIIAWNWMQRSKRRSTKKEVRRVIANASGRHADKAQPMSVERMRITKADRDKLRELRERFRVEYPGGLLMHPNCRCAGCELILAMHNALPGLLNDLDAAEAENKRLREALERIASAHDEHEALINNPRDKHDAYQVGASKALDWAQRIAKAALGAHP